MTRGQSLKAIGKLRISSVHWSKTSKEIRSSEKAADFPPFVFRESRVYRNELTLIVIC